VSFQQGEQTGTGTGSAYFVGLTNCEEVTILEEATDSVLGPEIFDQFGKANAWIEPDPDATFFQDDESSVVDWTSLEDEIKDNAFPTTDEDASEGGMPPLITGWDNDSDNESDDGSLPALIPNIVPTMTLSRTTSQTTGSSSKSIASKTLWICLRTLLTASWLKHVPCSVFYRFCVYGFVHD
jgi:hypothetical protein